MDQKNSNGEGAVDCTRIFKFDSSHASAKVPPFILHPVKAKDTDQQFPDLKNLLKNKQEVTI